MKSLTCALFATGFFCLAAGAYGINKSGLNPLSGFNIFLGAFNIGLASSRLTRGV
jgi:hypothetical protein